jgi:hypothetical protein
VKVRIKAVVVFKTEGKVLLNTDRTKPVNNVFVFIFPPFDEPRKLARMSWSVLRKKLYRSKRAI